MGDKMRDKTNEPVKELKGLTEQEVELRVEQGLDNRADTTTDKSIKEIIFSNAFTYFNLIFLIPFFPAFESKRNRTTDLSVP